MSGSRLGGCDSLSEIAVIRTDLRHLGRGFESRQLHQMGLDSEVNYADDRSNWRTHLTGLTRFRLGEIRKVRSRIGDCPKQSKFLSANDEMWDNRLAA